MCARSWPSAAVQVGSLAVPQLKFKVDINATELHLTGVAAIADEFCIVIVEGGEDLLLLNLNQ